MFDYSNLPDTIPPRELEKLLQLSGYAFITQFDGELYAFTGSLGGLPDEYLNPTEITINNVYLNFHETLSIKRDGVLIINDDMQLGLLPLFTKYNSLMVENDINIMVQAYNSRIQKLISASDDKTEQSARVYLEQVVDGEIGVIGESALFDGVKLHTTQSGQGNSLTSMIELQQYLRGTLFNEVGLNANFNMKRERLTGGEIEANDDVLYPFVDNMLLCREKGLESLNEKYSLGVSVRFGSIWAQKDLEVKHDDLELEGDNETQSELEVSTNEVISSGDRDTDEEETIDDSESEPEADDDESEPDDGESEPDDETDEEKRK